MMIYEGAIGFSNYVIEHPLECAVVFAFSLMFVVAGRLRIS